MLPERTRKGEKQIKVHRLSSDGTTIRDWVPIVKRAPIKVGCYTQGEKVLILELALLYFVQKHGELKPEVLSKCFRGQLFITRCQQLLDAQRCRHTPAGQLIDAMVDIGFLTDPKIKGRFIRAPVSLTPKGRSHIKRQSKRLKAAAQKIVFTDVLERLARV